MVPPPLPREAFTIEGGCNCKAVRYKVDVPRFEDRPSNPYHTPGVDVGDLRIPTSVVCHCNNCRTATSAVFNVAFITDVGTLSVSLAAHDAIPHSEGTVSMEEDRSDFIPAKTAFDPRAEPASRRLLTVYKSSHQRSRWFCRRCGTPIAYTVDPEAYPAGWDSCQMVDVWAGTIDREYLEQEWMAPERMLWCIMGVPWIRRMARSGGDGVPEHPLTKIDVLVDEGGESSM